MANGWDTPVVTTDAGEMLATCLNPYNATQQEFQRAVGVGVASAATATFILVGAIGLASLLRVKRAFRQMCALPEVKAMATEGASSMASSLASSRKPEFNIQMLPTGSQRSTSGAVK